MKKLKSRYFLAAGLAVIAVTTAVFGLTILNKTGAYADGGAYNQSYRNRLAFSANEGWNNDPNGLLYVNGVYHMYYQYNWNKEAGGGTGATENGWGHMSWGHATSTDLVYWNEQPVAIPAYQTVNGKYYAMMFSGSAGYD